MPSRLYLAKEMLSLQPHPLGTILPVKAHAGARLNAIRGSQDGALKVSVTQAPEKGKANKAIADVLHKQLKLRRSQIELLSGETSAQKQFLICDVTPDELLEAIRPYLA